MFFNKKEKTSQQKATEAKIDQGTQQVLDLEATKKRLQMEVEQIQLELQNARNKSQMELEKIKHKHELELDSQKAVFNREKQIWDKEKQELIDRHERDKEEFEERLKKDHEVTLQEAVTLTKLESQQKIKQAELDRDRAINDIKTEYAEKLADAKTKAAEENYVKFKQVFEELQLNGDKNSKFTQELAMKMIEALPTAKTRVDVGVGKTEVLEASKEG